MFDGIIKNMLTDLVRGIMIAIAGSLGLSGSIRDQFIAGGLAIFAGLWMWYENSGHQEIVELLKKSTKTVTLDAAKNVASKSAIVALE